MRFVLITAAVLISLVGVRAEAYPLDHLKTTDDIGPHKNPSIGTSHILVVPTRVGQPMPANRWTQLQQVFATEGGPGTFRHYWNVISGGRYDPIPYLMDPVIFNDICPIPDRSLDNCQLAITDIALIANGGAGATFGTILERLREEQDVDFSFFDVNGAEPGVPDGYFDGVIIDTDIYSGIGFPLAAFANEVVAGATAIDDPVTLTCGIVALVPPDKHEFGHTLGLIDLYGGPNLNDVMSDEYDVGISAYTRQQLGWGEAIPVDGPGEFELAPVLSGGTFLRFGTPPRYVLLENRGGPLHAQADGNAQGLHTYSVDETALPSGLLGFLDINSDYGLYLPNADPPYLNISLPRNCTLGAADVVGSCAIRAPGKKRDIIHASGEDLGWTVEILDRDDATGTIKLAVREAVIAPFPDSGSTPHPDAGMPSAPGDDAGTQDDPLEAGGGCAVSHPSSSRLGLALRGILLIAFCVAVLVRRRRARRNR